MKTQSRMVGDKEILVTNFSELVVIDHTTGQKIDLSHEYTHRVVDQHLLDEIENDIRSNDIPFAQRYQQGLLEFLQA